MTNSRGKCGSGRTMAPLAPRAFSNRDARSSAFRPLEKIRLASLDCRVIIPRILNLNMKRIIVGTAGHIDHGKTSLVKALTGIDADRLKEEKERGITIDIGFAD